MCMVMAAMASASIKLGASSFEAALADSPLLFVKFHAPWYESVRTPGMNGSDHTHRAHTFALCRRVYARCGWCTKLNPEWTQLASAVEGSVVHEVDCTAEATLCSTLEVNGYPSLQLFKGGKFAEEYIGLPGGGGRDLASLASFLQAHGAQLTQAYLGSAPGASPPMPVATAAAFALSDSAAFATQLASRQATLVSFSAPWCKHCKDLVPVWAALQTAYPGTVFSVDCSTAAAKPLCKEQGVLGFPTLALYNSEYRCV